MLDAVVVVAVGEMVIPGSRCLLDGKEDDSSKSRSRVGNPAPPALFDERTSSGPCAVL